MKRALLAVLIPVLGSCARGTPPSRMAPAAAGTAGGSWYFAVSGDSRDCGDVVMPKIAAAIAAGRQETPVALYWHLGDFRRMYDIDCDVLKRLDPGADCKVRPFERLPRSAMGDYLDAAWDDFLARQIGPFGDLPVFLTIGNHELYNLRTRDEYRRKFRRWLTQHPIHSQRILDRANGVRGMEGDTYYHWVWKGVDFISLDNADDPSAFGAEQLAWLERLLDADLKDEAVKSIVVGMHAALPESAARSHGMDKSCAGVCSGRRAYGLLAAAQRVKRVTVSASHSHELRENIYDTPEHRGNVLPGWIVGTAGAVQYSQRIGHGYLEVEVRADGSLVPRFREVTRQSPPLPSGPEAESLTDFCFEKNGGESRSDRYEGPCDCGLERTARP